MSERSTGRPGGETGGERAAWPAAGATATTQSRHPRMPAMLTQCINDPIWLDQPASHLVPDDRTPKLERDVIGDFLVLVEKLKYRIFTKTSELNSRGNPKTRPINIETYWIHIQYVSPRPNGANWTRTYKVYRHQGKMLYADSSDFDGNRTIKSAPPKDRNTMVLELCRILREKDVGLMGRILSRWTDGN